MKTEGPRPKTNAPLFFIIAFGWSLTFWALTVVLGGIEQLPGSILQYVGVAWATWHIPLFLIDGTFQNQLGFGSFRFWIFLASNVPLVVIMTWIYNHTDRSVLSVVLVHFSGNIIGAVFTKTDRLALLELIGLSLVAVMLAVRYGGSLVKGE